MAKYLMIGFAAPVPGKEAEFTQWYEKYHLSDMVSIPAISSGRFFKPAYPSLPGEAGVANAHYLSIYEFETDDLSQFYLDMAAFAASANFTLTDSYDKATHTGFIFEAVSEVIT